MYSPARNRSREAVVAVARVSVRYLILLATLHVYYPLRAPRLSARSPLPATTGERSRTEPARNRHGQPRNEERMKERKEGRGEHLFDIWLLFREQKRQTNISNPNSRILESFSHHEKKKERLAAQSSILPGTERKTLVRYRRTNVSITARNEARLASIPSGKP